MPFTDFLFSSAKPREDDHDQIGSDASTPPGISTPQPDTHDKRLPGILSSYFGQVGSLSNTAPLVPCLQLSSTSIPTKLQEERKNHHSNMAKSTDASDTASNRHDSGHAKRLPDSPQSRAESSGELDMPPLLPHEKVHVDASQKNENEKLPPKHPYPTPPMSSASSSFQLPQKARADDTTAESRRTSAQDTEASATRFVGIGELVSLMRRQTLSSRPQSGIATPNVHASHISNPLTSAAAANPLSSLQPSSADHSSATSPGTASDGLTSSSKLQNTPPRTPRSLSISSRPSRQSSPSTRQGPTSHPSVGSNSSRKESTTEGALLGEPQGKLAVSISAGRGLKPSQHPYVVCQFQSNEYISRGPRSDSEASEEPPQNALRGIPMQRSDSGTGRPMAIPMKSRQSSHTGTSSKPDGQNKDITEPVWNHDATFDVVGEETELDVSVYDHSQAEAFLGHVRFSPTLTEEGVVMDQWFRLEPRAAHDDKITGEIHLRLTFQRVDKRHYGPEDFSILKLIGKGTFGQVFQVRKKDTQRVYAMKVLSKKVIVQKKEVQHTVGERNILVRTAMTHSPFIVGLKFSFQTPTDLYLVTDYMSGGELFWHLQKEGRFHEERAKFYIAELILALQHLHQHDIVYRDLKPENILLDATGHIALCDFGLSKANLTKDDTTNTFCGTTEYLAPEVLLDEAGYTKMVDFWSLGVLVFEMCCGWSPFYAEDTQQMYKNIAFGKVRFPRDALSNEGRNFVKGLLNRNPKHRLGANGDAEELKQHPFFSDVDWIALGKKNLTPPFKPRLKSETDTSNFDPEFTNALNGASSLNARAAALASGVDNATTPLSPTMQAKFKGFTFVDESTIDKQFGASHRQQQQGALQGYEDEGSDDAMDEDYDEEEDVPDWEYSPGAERMSGITRSVTGGHGPEDGMFAGEEY